MNRKLLSLLALILTLVMACAPLSALAESYSSVALTLKNPSITSDGETHSAEIALTLDGGVDVENSMGRLLFSLMGGSQTVLSGGANWDGESIIAGLDGMKKSVKLPLSMLLDETDSDLSDIQTSFTALEPQLTALMDAFTALMDYVPSEEFISQAGELADKALNIEYNADASFEYDDETTLTGGRYDFSTTYADVVKLIEDLRALDPELDTLIGNLEIAFNDLITAVDGSTEVTEDAAFALSGYVMTTENGDFVISYDLSESADSEALISYQAIVFNNEADTQVSIYAELLDESDQKDYMVVEIVVPKEDGDITVSYYMDNIAEVGKDEGEGFHLLFATNNAAGSASLVFTYFEDYLYEGALYEDTTTYTLTYLAGEAVTDETGATYPGKVTLSYALNDEEMLSMSLETELRLYTSDQAFAASDDVVDLSNADSDEMSDLLADFSSVYNSAAAIIAAAPGMVDLISLFSAE